MGQSKGAASRPQLLRAFCATAQFFCDELQGFVEICAAQTIPVTRRWNGAAAAELAAGGPRDQNLRALRHSSRFACGFFTLFPLFLSYASMSKFPGGTTIPLRGFTREDSVLSNMSTEDPRGDARRQDLWLKLGTPLLQLRARPNQPQAAGVPRPPLRPRAARRAACPRCAGCPSQGQAPRFWPGTRSGRGSSWRVAANPEPRTR